MRGGIELGDLKASDTMVAVIAEPFLQTLGLSKRFEDS